MSENTKFYIVVLMIVAIVGVVASSFQSNLEVYDSEGNLIGNAARKRGALRTNLRMNEPAVPPQDIYLSAYTKSEDLGFSIEILPDVVIDPPFNPGFSAQPKDSTTTPVPGEGVGKNDDLPLHVEPGSADPIDPDDEPGENTGKDDPLPLHQEVDPDVIEPDPVDSFGVEGPGSVVPDPEPLPMGQEVDPDVVEPDPVDSFGVEGPGSVVPDPEPLPLREEVDTDVIDPFDPGLATATDGSTVTPPGEGVGKEDELPLQNPSSVEVVTLYSKGITIGVVGEDGKLYVSAYGARVLAKSTALSVYDDSGNTYVLVR